MALMSARSRPAHRARILGVLIELGTVSRADLARRTGLSPSTVSSVVAELQADGLVIDAPASLPAPPRPAPGRPAAPLCLHRSAGIVVGIDLGKRHLRVAASDLSHQLLSERRETLDADMPAADAIPLTVGLVDRVLEEAGVGQDTVVGVGMGLAGPVHEPSGKLGDSTILPGWVGVRAAEAMRDALGMRVEVENDANLGAISEHLWGAGRGVDDLVYLKAATGIGAGLILRGQPYKGAGGTAGELGHTVIDPSGPICRCGNRGCLEMLAGANAVLRGLQATHGDHLTLAEVIAFAEAGDFGCRRAIADAGRAIGTAVATLCNLLNPKRLIVGGDLGAAGAMLLQPLEESLGLGAIRSAADDLEVVEGALGDRAEVLGAVGLVLRRGPALLDAPRLRAVVR